MDHLPSNRQRLFCARSGLWVADEIGSQRRAPVLFTKLSLTLILGNSPPVKLSLGRVFRIIAIGRVHTLRWV
jgi:hypothetical protein